MAGSERGRLRSIGLGIASQPLAGVALTRLSAGARSAPFLYLPWNEHRTAAHPPVAELVHESLASG